MQMLSYAVCCCPLFLLGGVYRYLSLCCVLRYCANMKMALCMSVREVCFSDVRYGQVCQGHSLQGATWLILATGASYCCS